MAAKDLLKDCTGDCMSQRHGDCLTASLTLRELPDKELASYISALCGNGGNLVDSSGRTILHMSASLGRSDLVQWLIQVCGANINIRDRESGYTPLHRSIFYGQLNVTVILLQMGADPSILDNESLSPIELAMKDRLPSVQFDKSLPSELYVWGTNTNYNLGTDNMQGRLQPEALDFFRKLNQPVSITQVVMEKFHTVMVSACGHVWTCGHGQGGRLGLGKERTVLSPQKVNLGSTTKGFFQNPKCLPGQPEVCIAAAVGRDHTILLMESLAILVFGLNSHHVLGLSPPPVKLLEPQRLPMRNIEDMKLPPVGVCAGRYHSVIWSHGEVLTFGLHAGQLGHSKSTDKTFILPKPVSGLSFKDSEITQVVASDGATVIVTNNRHIWVLHEYQKTRISMRYSFVIEQLAVVGGHLDSELDPSSLAEKGAPLQIAAISKEGSVFLWQEKDLQMTRCILSPSRQLRIVDIHLNLSRTSLLMVTDDGEAYSGETKPCKKKNVEVKPNKGRRFPHFSPNTDGEFHVLHKQSERGPLKEFIDPDVCYTVRLEKLPHVHRAIKISSDPKGRNFALLQTHPSVFLTDVPELPPSKTGLLQDLSNLLSEANEWDTLHDIMFEVENRRFPAHQYLVARHSKVLLKMVQEAKENTMAGQVPTVKISDTPAFIFEQILCFLYTDECGLTHTTPFEIPLNALPRQQDSDSNLIPMEIVDKSASGQTKNLTKKTVACEPHTHSFQDEDIDQCNPLVQAKVAGKKLGLTKFVNQLNKRKYEDGKIIWDYSHSKKKQSLKSESLQVAWKKSSEFSDAHILSKDGVSFFVHRCVLAARSEYFYNMLAGGWIESQKTQDLQLPLDHQVLEILFDYMYTDATPLLENAGHIDFELALRTLIAADLLQINPFKVRCEAALAALLTLRNVKVVLEVAYTYNADNLRDCCYQFVCLNLSSALETGLLSGLPAAILNGLRDYYRKAHPRMHNRVVTPYDDAPSLNLIKDFAASSTVIWNEEINDDILNELNNQRKAKLSTKKKARVRRTSENHRSHCRTESVSSTNSDDLDTSVDADAEPLDWSNLVEKEESDFSKSIKRVSNSDTADSKEKAIRNDQWVKVISNSKAQKLVEARLKAAATARKEAEEVSFSCMVPLKKESHVIASTPAYQSSSSLKLPEKTTPESIVPPVRPVEQEVLAKHFPQLGFGRDSSKGSIPKVSAAINEKRMTKLSQKQRKRLNSEDGISSSLPSHSNINVGRAWEQREETLPSTPQNISLADIMQEQLKSKLNISTPSKPINIKRSPVLATTCPTSPGSPWGKGDVSLSPVTPSATPSASSDLSPGAGVRFSDIMADEMKQRENWTRMRAKPLSLTQIEDKAIEDLINFYNANEACEERITVRRVLTTQVARPVWVTSKHSC